MVDVAQLVEPRIVIPAVVGSNPIVHPNPNVIHPAFTSCGTVHAGDGGREVILPGGRRLAFRESLNVKTLFIRLLTVAPAVALVLFYGFVTGDIGNSHAVIALLLGMGVGLQVGQRPRSES